MSASFELVPRSTQPKCSLDFASFSSLGSRLSSSSCFGGALQRISDSKVDSTGGKTASSVGPHGWHDGAQGRKESAIRTYSNLPSMSADGPPARHLDVISQLQDQVNGLCSKLFNFLGALQRDAPPASVKGEGLLAPAGGVDLEAQTELMANEIVESFTAVEGLLQQLPPTDKTEAQQLQDIAALQQRNAAAAAELGRELAAAEGRLAQLQAAHGILADLQLARRGQRQRQQLPEQQEEHQQQGKQPGRPIGGEPAGPS